MRHTLARTRDFEQSKSIKVTVNSSESRYTPRYDRWAEESFIPEIVKRLSAASSTTRRGFRDTQGKFVIFFHKKQYLFRCFFVYSFWKGKFSSSEHRV